MLVSSVPLSLTHMAGLLLATIAASSSRATRAQTCFECDDFPLFCGQFSIVGKLAP
jgi:hypothetical protein